MVKLEIILNDNGNVEVNGPIKNKIFCLGLLEVAKRAVEDYRDPTVLTPDNIINDLR